MSVPDLPCRVPFCELDLNSLLQRSVRGELGSRCLASFETRGAVILERVGFRETWNVAV